MVQSSFLFCVGTAFPVPTPLFIVLHPCQGRPHNCFQGGQSRHFAYFIQIVGDATQMDVHKRKYPMLRQQLQTVFSL